MDFTFDESAKYRQEISINVLFLYYHVKYKITEMEIKSTHNDLYFEMRNDLIYKTSVNSC